MPGEVALGRLRRWAACVVWVASSTSALDACGGGMTLVTQHYDGPRRPGNRIALIRVNAAHGSEIVAIDGVPFDLGSALEPGNRLHVEVLPGTHEVDVGAVEPETGLRREIPVRFVAEPGRVYRVELVATAADPAAHREAALDAFAYEVDRDTDAHVRLAIAPPALPAEPSVGPAGARDAGGAPEGADIDSPADGAREQREYPRGATRP